MNRRKALTTFSKLLGAFSTSLIVSKSLQADNTETITTPPTPKVNLNDHNDVKKIDRTLATKADTYAPILMYHHIGGKPSRYNISPNNFEAQMRWLRENGFMPVSVDKIASALRGQATLPAKPIAITFDDGWKNQLNALPILREYGFIGTFYLVANYIANDSSNFVGWKDATTLLNQGHLLGSHSGRHSQQTKLFGANLAHDVIAARTAIHSHLGVTVTTHAYPYGSTNATVIRAVINAGYTAALGVWSRAYQSSSAIYNLNRLDAAGDISLIDFAKLMQGGSLNRAPAMPLTHHPSSRLQKSLPVKNTSSITSRA